MACAASMLLRASSAFPSDGRSGLHARRENSKVSVLHLPIDVISLLWVPKAQILGIVDGEVTISVIANVFAYNIAILIYSITSFKFINIAYK